MPRHFDDWLEAYLDYTAHSEAPNKFHFWTGIGTIAGALRRKVWLDLKYFIWVPNFYIVLVAPPGVVSKSTTVSIGMNLLREVEGVKFGPDAVTWQSLTQSLANSAEGVEIDGYWHTMSCITISPSEFGTFLDPRDRDMVDVLVDLWDGKQGVWEKQTKTQGSDRIENPWINLITCTTPSWIEGNFPEYMIGGGFTSRCVFVYADKKRHLVPYPDEAIQDDSVFEEKKRKLIEDLEDIASLAGQYVLSKEARAFGRQWYEDLQTNPPKHLMNSRFAGYISRKQTHVHKVAMVLAASRRRELIITRQDLIDALNEVTKLEEDMPKVFDNIGQSQQTRKTGVVIEVLKSVGGKAKYKDLYRQLYRWMTHDEFENSIKDGAQAGLLTGWPGESKENPWIATTEWFRSKNDGNE